eukprot:CAMPEP_0184336720 /NCGR_PEP_ID=MMETSP1089-20130417/4894_1 /TAXON_ID=38269 ORGANISM="Gloeochaete wittrockiana, Strain SAG46.84" /NCGR_SAMPLE_ID=MMETSP1089 /ASSEMBLY_ACC=CAM_ASM_000445 /LENGTH=102 /DNA_ID=CAMNT_0026661779 /DNA_START=192 /DNA_END=500 /DNA_ORIENTATION=+
MERSPIIKEALRKELPANYNSPSWTAIFTIAAAIAPFGANYARKAPLFRGAWKVIPYTLIAFWAGGKAEVIEADIKGRAAVKLLEYRTKIATEEKELDQQYN